MGRHDRKKPANNSFVASTAVEVDGGNDHIQLKHTHTLFSGKKKKESMNAKRAVKERKRNDAEQDYEAERTRQYEEFHGVQRYLDLKPEDQGSNSGFNNEELTAQGDLRSVFEKEADRDVEIRKISSRQQYDVTPPGDFGVVTDNSSMESIEMPVRPVWSRDETPNELDVKEKLYFKEYIENIQQTFGTNSLNSFELNIEVWRQLWRVIERSDILALIVDIRLPRLNFPSSLYKLLLSYGKSLVVVLNKVDLVSGDIVNAWKSWFEREYIGVKVVCMSKHPTVSTDAISMSNLIGKKPNKIVVEKTFLTSRPFGESKFLSAVRGELSKLADLGVNPEQISFEPTHIFKSDGYTSRAKLNPNRTLSIDSSSSYLLSAGTNSEGNESRNKSRSVSWGDVKAKRDLYDKNNDRDYYNTDNSNEFSDSDDDSDDGIDNYSDSELEFERQPNKLDLSDSVILSTEEATETLPVDKDGISPQRSGERSSFITIGFIGQPNAGKSSLINALAGRKVVSVSSTPGHTKHLQTIFLNTHTRVCDCPGLVFPSVWAPYPLQVLSGQINIAQVRETYSTLAYVGARYPLERSYGLDLSYTIPGRKGSDEEPKRSGWSGFSLAEAHAIKKSYYTSKQRPDTHRAGNEMLRDLQTGRIVFTLSPPDNI